MPTVKEKLVNDAANKPQLFTHSDMKDAQEEVAHAAKITSVFFFLFSQMQKLSYFEFLVQVGMVCALVLGYDDVTSFALDKKKCLPHQKESRGRVDWKKRMEASMLTVACIMVAESEGMRQWRKQVILLHRTRVILLTTGTAMMEMRRASSLGKKWVHCLLRRCRNFAKQSSLTERPICIILEVATQMISNHFCLLLS